MVARSVTAIFRRPIIGEREGASPRKEYRRHDRGVGALFLALCHPASAALPHIVCIAPGRAMSHIRAPLAARFPAQTACIEPVSARRSLPCSSFLGLGRMGSGSGMDGGWLVILELLFTGWLGGSARIRSVLVVRSF